LSADAQRSPASHGSQATVEVSTDAHSRRGSRAFGLGSRRTFALALAAVATLVVGVVLYLSRASGSPSTSLFAPSPTTAHQRYGGLPSWLPKAKVPVGRLVHASSAHPWLAIEGDTVAVALAHGAVRVIAVGPSVPEDGQFPVPKTTRCRFDVTFTAATGVVPVRSRAFTILDELGALHHPLVSGPHGGPVPRHVLPGQSVTLTLSAVLPTGAGTVRWTPTGTAPVVAWDFDVEID
jgi:hypothetical protein